MKKRNETLMKSISPSGGAGTCRRLKSLEEQPEERLARRGREPEEPPAQAGREPEEHLVNRRVGRG
jgi:hypothetical protein